MQRRPVHQQPEWHDPQPQEVRPVQRRRLLRPQLSRGCVGAPQEVVPRDEQVGRGHAVHARGRNPVGEAHEGLLSRRHGKLSCGPLSELSKVALLLLDDDVVRWPNCHLYTCVGDILRST